jgi:hypothetical protein
VAVLQPLMNAPPKPNKVRLLLPFNDRNMAALSISLAECTTFAVRPLKWLRFLGFAIYGCEGSLSTSKAGPVIDDYTGEVEARSYYFIPDGKLDCYALRSLLTLLTFSGEPRLIDIDAIDDRTSDASDLSERRADFRQRVIDRDGTCVITGDYAVNCTACHILPHSKGDNVRSQQS